MKRLDCVIILLCFSGLANATPLFTDLEKNAQITEEAALTGYSLLGDLFGVSLGNPLNITAGIFTASAWSFGLTGMYQGMPVALDFSGNFDAVSNSGSFSSAGVVGSSDISGLGSWTWTDVSPIEEDLNFSTSLATQTDEWDLETIPFLFGPKMYKKEDEDKSNTYVMDSGTWAVTHFGNVTGDSRPQISHEVRPKVKEFIMPATVSARLGTAYLTAAEYYPVGKVTGSVSTIPEPSTLIALATGLAGISACGWLRRRVKQASPAAARTATF
jgi:PEP-CTERM motif